MTSRLEMALWARLAFLAGEAELLRQAREFFQLTSNSQEKLPVAPAQMAAVGERLQTAHSLQDAQERVEKFLSHQLQKLVGKETSWRTPVTLPDGSASTLGEILRDWMRDEKYLPPDPVSPHLDRLAALRRFWNYIVGQYGYQQTFKEVMPLKEVAG
jgi:hypothetical protein